jgi:DNA-binding Lrp family transcriptional regulator
VTARPTGVREPIDELDRRIIVALQRDGRASWTDIAGEADASVATVGRRGQHLLSSGLVRIAAVPSISQWGPAEQLVVRLRCRAGEQQKVARVIAERPQVRFVSLVTGAHDIVAEVVAPKGSDLVALLIDELQGIPGVESSEADLVLHTYKIGHDWSRQQAAGPTPTLQTAATHVCSPGDFDELSDKIVEILREDGRTSYPNVAQTLGVNESTVRRRFETLVTRGCVQLVTLVSASALGYETEVLLWLDVVPSAINFVAHELLDHRGVRFIAATLGQSSMMCEVIMPTNEDLFQFTTSTLARLEGIRSWQASIELRTLKRGFVDLPWARSTTM